MLACCGSILDFFLGWKTHGPVQMSDENQVSGELGTSGSKKTVL